MIGLFAILFLAVLLLTGAWKLINKTIESFRNEFDWFPSTIHESPVADVVINSVVPATTPEVLIEVMHQTAVVYPVNNPVDIIAQPLIVKHLDQGKATLIVRYRVRKQACTAHLIVWSGAKRLKIQDSYYDLGIIPRGQVDAEVVSECLALARTKLQELKEAGRRTRKSKAVAVELQPAIELATQPEVAAIEEVVMAETVDVPMPDPSVKLKRFPSVFRGVILEIGMMQQTKNGANFDIYGVKYRTPEGIEDSVFGANLKVALHEAMAGVGDHVEILKIGRKTMEEGKAPMNLFQVSKLATLQ